MNIMMSLKDKYNRIGILSLLLLFILISHTNAQQKKEVGLPDEVMAWTISTTEPWPPDKYKSHKEAIIDNKFFVPLVFRGGIFPKIEGDYSLKSLRLTDYIVPSSTLPGNEHIETLFEQYRIKKKLDDNIYMNVLLKNPDNFDYTINQIPQRTIVLESIEKPTAAANLDIKMRAVTPEAVDPIIKFIPDRKYWISTFSADIKFSQNKSSENWHQGEINTMNIHTNTVTTYNYSRGKLSLRNTLTTNFTIANAPKDTLRNYTIGTDELRLTSNFGIKAIRNWSYSASAELITPMGNKYIANTKKKSSSFLSPYTINIGLGMSFNPAHKFKKKDRSLAMSIIIDPLSYKYTYSENKNINLGAYFPKDEEGNFKHMQKTFGSAIKMTITKFQFSKNVDLFSRFYYFTNYERVLIEFENRLDIRINKYFTTTFAIYPRFDDGITKKEGSDTYLQMNESFSFGFKYSW